MRSARARATGVGALVIAAAVAPARAEDGPGARAADEVIVVHSAAPTLGGPHDLDGDGQAARDGARALGETPMVTVIHPDDHLAQHVGVAGLIGGTVGASVRSLGGLGAFASISVRGASSGHTAVIIDGVPLARVGTVSADLGRFDAMSYDQIDLYRGAVPIELAGAGLGGALTLTTRLGPTAQGDRLLLSLGGGSLMARHARLRWGEALGAAGPAQLAAVVTAGYRGARGDFAYYDNGGTTLDASDDTFQRRANNAFDEADVAARIGRLDGTRALGVRLVGKRQGLPGAIGAETMQAALATAGLLLDGSAVGEGRGRLAGRHRGYLSAEAQRFDDPADEIGVGAQARRYLVLAAGAATAWDLALGASDAHRATAALDGFGELMRDADVRGDRGTNLGQRVGGGLALAGAIALADRRVVIEPAARLDVVRTAPPPDAITPLAGMLAPRWDVPVSPRIGVRVLPTPALALKASAGRYARLPTAMELFGDRGYVVGTPELRAETGPALEGGVVWAPGHALARGAIDRVLVEAGAFASWPRDTIALVTIGGNAARPLNVGDAFVRGVELAASARLAEKLSLRGNLTRLRTEQRSLEPSFDGKPLPRQPELVLGARLDAALRASGHLVAPWLELDWQAASFLDQAALRQVPARALLGAGLVVELRADLLLGLDVRNLTDERVAQLPLANPPRPDLTEVPTAMADVAGYPLPGRAFYASLVWRR